MDKKSILQALEKLKKDSKKRKFSQSIDVIFTLKDLNLKVPEQQVDFFMSLQHAVNKKKTVCALVGPDLADECKKVCDLTITPVEFEAYKEKSKARGLAKKYDYFIAQGNLMGQVAATFGRVFGPRGKMPNPKVGAVVLAKPQIKPLYDKLQQTVHLVAKKEPVVHVMVGKEDQKTEEVVENIMQVYDQLVHHLPKEQNNISGAFLKFTMSKPVKM